MRYRNLLPLMSSCCFVLIAGCSSPGRLAPAALAGNLLSHYRTEGLQAVIDKAKTSKKK